MLFGCRNVWTVISWRSGRCYCRVLRCRNQHFLVYLGTMRSCLHFLEMILESVKNWCWGHCLLLYFVMDSSVQVLVHLWIKMSEVIRAVNNLALEFFRCGVGEKIGLGSFGDQWADGERIIINSRNSNINSCNNLFGQKKEHYSTNKS
jgi:hypothetical protein